MSVYIPTIWKNGAPPAINGANLNKMEAGIQSVHKELDDVVAGVITVAKAIEASIATDVTGKIPLSTQFKIGGSKMDTRSEDNGYGTLIDKLYIDTTGY